MVCVPLVCFVLLFPLGRRDGDWGGAILMGCEGVLALERGKMKKARDRC